MIGDGRGSCRVLGRWSAGSEEGLLVFPGDGETDLVHEALRGQLDRMAAAQDGLDDIRRQEAEPQDPSEVGSADTNFGGAVSEQINLFHQARTVSWQISIPRSLSRSSTCRNDRGKRIYIITARRITSGEVLK